MKKNCRLNKSVETVQLDYLVAAEKVDKVEAGLGNPTKMTPKNKPEAIAGLVEPLQQRICRLFQRRLFTKKDPRKWASCHI